MLLDNGGQCLARERKIHLRLTFPCSRGAYDKLVSTPHYDGVEPLRTRESRKSGHS